MAMSRSTTGLAYPDRFFAAASYVGFGESQTSTAVLSKFQNDVALLLYALYQQATVGPCNDPKPRAWNPVEYGKWNSWHGLQNMASTEAMRLFVKILEEEDPAWYSRISEPSVEPNSEMHKAKVEPPGGRSSGDESISLLSAATASGRSMVISGKTSFPESKHIITENGDTVETQDKDIIMEGLGAVGVYDKWIKPPISGHHPKPRYEHGAAVVRDKMYIFGGNHNGRYLNDLQVLDLKSLMWSKLDAKVSKGSSESSTLVQVAPRAGHSLISWDSRILSVAGHTKDPSETVTVTEFDPQTLTWSDIRTYGKPPISRGGQSVTLVGTTLVIFGGEDAKRSLLNDLHILDLETMTWDDIDTIGTPPSPRSDHAAVCHAERYLLIFGGGSHATCFNDLHVLDLQTMEWSRPKQHGIIPGPRAGHAGIKVGESWFIVGGGDNKNGVSETLVLNMSTLVWSVVTTVQGRVPLASEGLSVVLSTCNGEDYLVSFGGYNGRYSNEVYVLKPIYKSDLQSKMIDKPTSDSMATVIPPTNVNRDLVFESEVAQDGKITEIIMNNVDPEPLKVKTEESGEHVIAALKAQNDELEASLSREQSQTFELKQELAEAETKNMEISKELQSLRGQLAAEQSRCFKLEVDLAELRQKLQNMETLKKEVELLQRQKAASEQAALSVRQRQSSGGVWNWLAGSPPEKSSDYS